MLKNWDCSSCHCAPIRIARLRKRSGAIAGQGNAALAVAASPFFDTRRDMLVGLAARHAVPTMFHFREFVSAGGLVSYGIHFADAYRQVGVHTGQILRGTKPSDLP